MQKKREKIQKGLQKVFKKPTYWVITISTASLFFILNMLLPNIKTLGEVASTLGGKRYIYFVIALIQGGIDNITATSLTMLITIATLVGVMVSLITYQVKMTKMFAMHDGKATTIGALLGIAAPGCASCGVGVLSAIGLTSALTYLPFKGLEIAALSVVLLVGSTGSLASRIADGDACKINFSEKKR